MGRRRRRRSTSKRFWMVKRPKDKSRRFYISHGRIQFGKNGPSEAAESTTVRSDRGRTDSANHGVGRARERERGREGETVMTVLCPSARPDFPLAGPGSQKACAGTGEAKGATSSRFFDKKKTEMGRKGKLARGRTKGIASPHGKQPAKRLGTQAKNLPANRKDNTPFNHFDQRP